MEPNKILQSAINNGNISAAQAVILASFRKACNEEFYQFIELALYAKKKFNEKGSEFFITDDGKTEFTQNSDNWNVDLWKNLRVELEYNFSEKKLDYITQVMAHLRSIGHKDFQVKQELTKSNQSQVEPNSGQVNNLLAIGFIAGVVLGTGFGTLIGRPIMGGMLGAAIGGGIAHTVKKAVGADNE